MAIAAEDRWQQLVAGAQSPFCVPRADENQHWAKIASLAVSSLYLSKDQAYRGYSLLVFDGAHATRPSDLDLTVWAMFCLDLHWAQAAVERATSPDHINVAALGNQVPHLHWHIIPRYKTDARWGAPIWMTDVDREVDAFHPPEAEFRQLLDAIRAELF